MFTIEKLFVQIFDRKRQFIEQLNQQKQLYNQNLASKLLIQGITPPPWLLNSDKFGSTSTSASDSKDLNKEELISGLLLPFPQPLPSFFDANLYGKPLTTVDDSELQHDLANVTSARCKGTDDCRPGVLPQCLFRGLEDVHHQVAETPQEKVASDISADPDLSLARMQRSKSRQKALELRSSGKGRVKYQLEDNPPTGPRRQGALKGGSATAGILSSSKDECSTKKQEISSNKEGNFFTTYVTDASADWLSPPTDCRNLPVEESVVVAESVSCKGGIPRHLLKEPVFGIDGSSHRQCANSNLWTEELIENQGLFSKEEEISKCCTKEFKNSSDVGGAFYINQKQPSHDPSAQCLEPEHLEACNGDGIKAFEVDRTSEPLFPDHLIGVQATRDSLLKSPLQEAASSGLFSLAAKSEELFSPQLIHASQPGQGSTEGGLSCGLTDVVPCLVKASDGVYSGKDILDTDSLDVHNVQIGESAAEPASAHGLSDLIASQVVNLSAEEPVLLDEVVSSQRMQLASESSAKNKLQGGRYSGESKHDTNSLEVYRVKGVCPTEIPTCHGLSNEITGQLVNPSVQEHSCQFQVEQPTSVSSDRMKLVIGFTGKTIFQDGERYSSEGELGTSSSDKKDTHIKENHAEVASTHSLSAVKIVNMSPEKYNCHNFAGQPASVPSGRMKLATDFSGNNKLLDGNRYLGNSNVVVVSLGKFKRRAGESLVEAASTHVLSDVVPDQSEDLCPEEPTLHLEVDQSNSLPSKRVKHATNSSGNHEVPGENPRAGESVVEATFTDALSHVISEQLEDSSPEEHISQLEVEQTNSLSSKRVKHATDTSGKHKAPGENSQVGESIVEAASTHLLSNETSGQLKDLTPEEYFPQFEVEHPNSLSSPSVKHVTGSSGKHKVPGENPEEGAPIDILSHMVGDQPLTLSSAKLTHELDSDHYVGEYSGENGRKSQGRCEASTEQTNTEVRFSLCGKAAECSGTTANELGTIDSEDYLKHASVGQKLKLADAQLEAAELQVTCFSKEVKFSVSPKLCELQTLFTESSRTSSVGGSWPRQKRRKIESVINKSASPNLRVTPSNIFSHGVYVAKSCLRDFSASKMPQNDSSLNILPEQFSTKQHVEEKLSFQGSSDVELENLLGYTVTSPSQHLPATSQECLDEADLSRGKCNFSFSISKVDADPADDKICRREDSLGVQNTCDYLAGSPVTEYNETVVADGDKPDLQSFTFDKKWENAKKIRDTDVYMAEEVGDNVADTAKSSPTASYQQVSLQKVKNFGFLGDSPMEHRDIVGRKGAVDLENFTFESESDVTHDTGDLERLVAIDLPKNMIDRAKFLERLCRSASLGVPLSHFHDLYCSDEKMDVYHSVPVGVLEQADLRNSTGLNAVAGQTVEASPTCTKYVEKNEFQGNSFSEFSPIHGTPFAWDFKGPYMSPIVKEFEGVAAGSRRSSKRGSLNPELTCFPIEESGEEDANADDSDHNSPKETDSIRKSLRSSFSEEESVNVGAALDPASKMVHSGSVTTSSSDGQRSSNPDFTCIPVEESSEQHVNVIAAQTCQGRSASTRQPLHDISNPSSKSSTESFSSASGTSEINKKIRQNSQAQPHQSGTARKRKENQNFSLSTASAKKHLKSYNTRFSRGKVSVKSVLDNRGGSFSEKDPKPNNIVSSIKSFLPLVKRKQAASCAPVKKEVRVKALEAAEAAKRLAEQKENERKQKKEALKLERARQEQENLKRLELLKKAKVEERKKKDAEMAERKRKREEEEEEKKDKVRKKKSAGEARKQQKGHANKISVDKEECKSHVEDEKTDRGQEVERDTGNQANNQAASGVLPIASGDLEINELKMSSDLCQELKDISNNVAGCSTPTPDVNYTSATQTIQEKSYDISPYCNSDDEEELDDELSNKKFQPSWSSKSSIMAALASLNTLDPEVIFSRSSFRNLDEVLRPRELKQR